MENPAPKEVRHPHPARGKEIVEAREKRAQGHEHITHQMEGDAVVIGEGGEKAAVEHQFDQVYAATGMLRIRATGADGKTPHTGKKLHVAEKYRLIVPRAVAAVAIPGVQKVLKRRGDRRGQQNRILLFRRDGGAGI